MTGWIWNDRVWSAIHTPEATAQYQDPVQVDMRRVNRHTLRLAFRTVT